MPLGNRTSEWRLALGVVAAGVVLAVGGFGALIAGTGLGWVGIASGAAMSAVASLGYSVSRSVVKANQAATARHRQL